MVEVNDGYVICTKLQIQNNLPTSMIEFLIFKDHRVIKVVFMSHSS